MPVMTSATTSSGSGSLSLLILAVPLALLAYLMFTQRRRAKRELQAQQSLEIGDEVMTRAGMFGVIVGLDGPVVRVTVAPDVVVAFDRRAIIPAPRPAEADEGREGPDGEETPGESTR